jgi:pantoate--beta-alanine ligase
MRLVRSIGQVKKIITSIKKKGDRIGLVPTMGYLHDGHLSLVRTARRKCDFLIVSVFVNPAQFGPKEDFHKYPRNLSRDLRLLRKEGVDLVFNPPAKAMYPEGFRTYVEVSEWSRLLCGASRPIHFRGVTTVVLKLFNIMQPDIVVFGGKDYQQAVIIKKMVKDLNLSVKVMTGKIVREPDGLAMSSRNAYLSAAERKSATVLYGSLKRVRQSYKRGLRDAKHVKHEMALMIKSTGGKIDYIEAVDKDTLEPVNKLRKGTLIAIAVFFGRTRLIDNTVL